MAELNGDPNVSSSAYSQTASGLLNRMRNCKDSWKRRHMFIGIGIVAIIFIILIVASIATMKGKFLLIFFSNFRLFGLKFFEQHINEIVYFYRMYFR